MLPDELFRFVALRAPRASRTRLDLELTTNPTPFVRLVLDALRTPEARGRVQESVEQFLAADAFPRQPRERPVLALLDDFHGAYHRARPGDAAAALELASTHLGAPPAEFLEGLEAAESRDLARDAIVALKLAREPRRGLLATFTRVLQTIRFLERLVATPLGIDFSSPSRALSLPVRFAAELAGLQTPRTDSAPPAIPQPEDTAAARRISRIAHAIVELSAGASEFTRRQLPAAEGGRNVTVLAATARERLSSTTRAVMAEEAIDIANTDFLSAMDALEGVRVATVNELSERDANGDESARVALGSLVMPAAHNTPLLPLDPAFIDPSTRPPTTVGPVEPNSVGQLLITRQQIKRYEAGEISHVENVLRSESRSRTTRRLTRTEESFVVEQERLEEEERDLQTTERSAMRSEIEKTLADSRAFEVGGSISAGYGPFIQVEAHTDYQTESTTEQSESKASEFAREMSERTAKKVSERIRTQQTRTTLEEFEENNSHGFDNTNGEANVTGIYQWLDRIYELQVYDAGVRIIFQFTVPEPAALYLRALQSQVVKSEGLERPPPLTIRAKDINANNYDKLAARYLAEGVVPPPPYRITIGHAFSHASPEGRPSGFAASETVKIKPGYRAVIARAEIKLNELSDLALSPGFGGEEGEAFAPPTQNRVDILIANRRLFYAQEADQDDRFDLNDTLDNLDGEVAVAVTAVNIVSFAATVSIECLRRAEAYEEWQLKTYEALATAYHARLAEFENQRAALATQQTGPASGRNPTHNRIIEQNEIKRLAIMMLSGQRFHATAVPLSPQAAEFDFDRALTAGNYVRFWETVIEWRNLDYVFHPYYWADQSTWARMLVEDTDPLHAQFIAAGAATVRLAITPGFEVQVLHYLETGNIWTGGELPEVTRDDFIAFLDEIEARRPQPPDPNQPLGGMPSEEIPRGEPWEIRLPTTLVALRPDGTLPRWVKDETGEWIPIELQPANP